MNYRCVKRPVEKSIANGSCFEQAAELGGFSILTGEHEGHGREQALCTRRAILY
jgi:hypothetical protein